MIIESLLRDAKKQLANATDCPLLEAEVLLAHALNKPRSYLYAYPRTQLTYEESKLFFSYLIRRLGLEPIAYIRGRCEFWSLELAVNAYTLIPRPETELLVQSVLNHLDRENADTHIADLGTGSGAIAIALAHECPRWQLHATDSSRKALDVAKKNAMQFSLHNISFYQGDWCNALPARLFDAILSNPPYIAKSEWPIYAPHLIFEPYQALVSGDDGLNDLRQIVAAAKSYLKQGGYLLTEHGWSQGQAVRALFAEVGLTEIQSYTDLSGHERATIGRLA